MRAIRSTNMTPEMVVRRATFALGYRYRLHRKDLPGKPDLAFIGRRKAIFVHGCFWHQHQNCRHGRRPQSNSDYWEPKLARNVERDATNEAKLIELGWKVLTVWECEISNISCLKERIADFLEP